MGSDEYRCFRSGRSIALDNNSGNVLASNNLKSDGNLRVGSADWSRSPWNVRGEKVRALTWLYERTPLGPQVHTCTGIPRVRTAVDRTRGTGKWVIIEEKWKKRVHARKHVAAWNWDPVQSRLLCRNLSPDECVHTHTFVRSCWDTFLTQPNLSPFSPTYARYDLKQGEDAAISAR